MPFIAEQVPSLGLASAQRDLYSPQALAEQQQADIANTTEFGKGWTSSGLGDDAGGMFAKANEAYANGDHVNGQVFEQQARDLQQKAAAYAPTVQNFTDIHDVGSAADWAGGALGQMRSSIAPAVAGTVGAGLGAAVGRYVPGVGAVTGARIGGAGGAALAGGNMEYNESMANAMSDPQIRATRSMEDINKAAWVKGMVNAGLEAYVPWAMAKGLIGLGANEVKDQIMKHVAKGALKSGAEEFATEGAQNIVGQGAQNWLAEKPLTDIDPKSALNDGMAGAIGGHVMGGVGAAGEYVHADKTAEPVAPPKPMIDKVTEGIGNTLEAAGRAVEKGRDKAQTWSDNLGYQDALKGEDYRNFTGKSDFTGSPEEFTAKQFAQAKSADNFATKVISLAGPGFEDQDVVHAAVTFKKEINQGVPPEIATNNFRKTVRELHKLDDQTKKFSAVADVLTPEEKANRQNVEMPKTYTDNKATKQEQSAFMGIWAKKFNDKFPVATENAGNKKAVLDHQTARNRALSALFNFAKLGFKFDNVEEGTVKHGLPKPLKDLLGDKAAEAIRSLATDMEAQGWLWSADADTGHKLAEEIDGRTKFNNEYARTLAQKLSPMGHAEFVGAKPEAIMHKLLVEAKNGSLSKGRLNILFGKNANIVSKQLDDYEKQDLGGKIKKEQLTEGADSTAHELDTRGMTKLTFHTYQGKEVGSNATFDKTHGAYKFGADIADATDALRKQHGYAPDIQEVGVVDALHEKGTREIEARIRDTDNAQERRTLRKELKAYRKVAEDAALEKYGSKVDLKDMSQAARTKAVNEINDRFRVLRIENNVNDDSTRIDKEDVQSYKVDVNLGGEGATIAAGAIHLEQKLQKNVKGGKKGDAAQTPFSTLVGRILALSQGDQKNVTVDEEGPRAVRSKVMSTLSALIEADPDRFTGRIGVIEKIATPIRWLEQGEGIPNLNLERRPNTGPVQPGHVNYKGQELAEKKRGGVLPDDFKYLNGKKPVTEAQLKPWGESGFTSWVEQPFDKAEFAALDDKDKRDVFRELENHVEELQLPGGEDQMKALEKRLDQMTETLHQDLNDFMEGDPMDRPMTMNETFKGENSVSPRIPSLSREKDDLLEPRLFDEMYGMSLSPNRLSPTEQPLAQAAEKSMKDEGYRIADQMRHAVMRAMNKGIPAFNEAIAKITSIKRLDNLSGNMQTVLAQDKITAKKAEKFDFLKKKLLAPEAKAVIASAIRSVQKRGAELASADQSPRMQKVAAEDEAAEAAKAASKEKATKAREEEAKKPKTESILMSDEQLAQPSTEADKELGAKNNTIAREKLEDAEFARSKKLRDETPEARKARLDVAKEKAAASTKPITLSAKELSDNAKDAVDIMNQNDIRAYAWAGGEDVAAAMADGLAEVQRKIPVREQNGPRANAVKRHLAWLSEMTSPEKVIQSMHSQDHIGSLKRARTILNTMIDSGQFQGAELKSLVDRRDNITALGKSLINADNPILKSKSSQDRVSAEHEARVKADIRKILGDRAPVEKQVSAQFEEDEDAAADRAEASMYSRMEGVFPTSREVIEAAEKGDFAKAVSTFERMTKLFDSKEAKSDPQFQRARQAFSVARDRLEVAKNNAAKSTPTHAAAMLQEIKQKMGIAFSEMNAAADSFTMSKEEKVAFKAKHEERFGKAVKAAFAKKGLTDNNGVPISGVWTEKLIRISMYAKDKMGIYDHESMHQLFSYLRQFGGEETVSLMQNVATNKLVLNQLEKLLRDHPQAIKQLSNAEEAAAYMFQFWNARDAKGERLLKLGPKATGFFGKIGQVLREIFTGVSQIEKDQYMALQVMEAFDRGAWSDKPDAATEAITKLVTTEKRFLDQRDGIANAIIKNPLLQKFIYSNWSVLKDTANPYFIGISKQFAVITGNKVDPTKEAFFSAKKRELHQRLNKLEEVFVGLDDDEVKIVNEYMVKGEELHKIAVPRYKAAVKAARAFLDDMHKYAVDAGVKRYDPESHTWKDLGFIKDKYFPINWNVDTVTLKSAEFIQRLKDVHMVELEAIVKQAEEERATGEFTPDSAAATVPAGTPITVDDVAHAIVNKIINSAGTGEVQESATDIGITPYAKAVEKRTLSWLDHGKFSDFVNTDMRATMASYTTQMVKRAESVRIFGNDSKKLRDQIDRAYAFNLLGDEKLVDEAVAQYEKAHGTMLEKYGYKKGRSEHHTSVMATLLQKDTSELKADMKARVSRLARAEKNLEAQQLNVSKGFGDETALLNLESAQELVDLMEAEQLEVKDEIARREKEGDATRVPKYNKTTLRGMAESMMKGSEEERTEKIKQAYKDMTVPLKAIQALEGTLGSDISPGVQSAMQAITAYQHARVLMTGLFSSFIDPAGIIINGGEATQAFKAFVRGLQAVKDAWLNNPEEQDTAVKAAIQIGAIAPKAVGGALGESYGNNFTGTGLIARINDAVFHINGMEAFTRAMRIQGTAAGIGFIERHLNKPTQHSARRLSELGLNANEKASYFDAAGSLDLDNRQVQIAVNRWVDDAILNPNAAHRPINASDPHYQLFYSLKQFTYTFHNTILRRCAIEAKEGNFAPFVQLVGTTIPIMIGADAIKAMMMPGEPPAWMRSLPAMIWHGVERANLGGIGQMYQMNLPIIGDGRVASEFGPAVSQMADILSIPFSEDHSLIGEALRGLPGGNVMGRFGPGAEKIVEKDWID